MLTSNFSNSYNSSVLSITNPPNLYAGRMVADPRQSWKNRSANTIIDLLKAQEISWASWVRSRYDPGLLARIASWYGGSILLFNKNLQNYDNYSGVWNAGAGIKDTLRRENEALIAAIQDGQSAGVMPVFVTYDEAGGIYDHSPPPLACEPDNLLPMRTGPYGGGDLTKYQVNNVCRREDCALDSSDRQYGGSFNRYGFRVPFYVISPWAKKNYVSHRIYDHTSITRFIEARYNLPALTRRDGNCITKRKKSNKRCLGLNNVENTDYYQCKKSGVCRCY